MAETNGSRTKDISPELLRCPVCDRRFTDPKILPCLHSFCQRCLQDSLEQSNIGSGQEFLCPLCHNDCKVPKRGVAGFQHNVFIDTLQEYSAKKSVPRSQKCEGCDMGALAARKCIECDDWLCTKCCNMHSRVKVTRKHHLVTPEALRDGHHDKIIKDSFEPLICGKHEEPLKLYCTEPGCQIPICTVCKTTLGHDGHRAIELETQGRQDSTDIKCFLPNLQRSIDVVNMKVANIKQEERMTSTVKKKMHKEINSRLEKIMQDLVKQLGDYAEELHKEVDKMVKEHKDELKYEAEKCTYRLAAMNTAQLFAKNLVSFGRAEEVVAMARPVCQRLSEFQRIPDSDAPSWRHPRLHPAEPAPNDVISKIFGELTFEGEAIKCMLLKSFSIKAAGDERACAISDVTISEENDIIVVDRDNKRVKVFDTDGKLLYASAYGLFKAPNRVTSIKPSGNVLVKDDKVLRVLSPDGHVTGTFAPKLRHPVASAQTKTGEILVTDWQTGCVHFFDALGGEIHSFGSNLEAPAYVSSTQNGNVVISDWKQNFVRAYDNKGKFVFQYGEEGSGIRQLNHPYGVCGDQYGHVLIADNWNNRVHMMSEEGKFLRFLLEREDGLQWPQALVVDKNGHLIVAELHGNVKIYQYLA